MWFILQIYTYIFRIYSKLNLNQLVFYFYISVRSILFFFMLQSDKNLNISSYPAYGVGKGKSVSRLSVFTFWPNSFNLWILTSCFVFLEQWHRKKTFHWMLIKPTTITWSLFSNKLKININKYIQLLFEKYLEPKKMWNFV